MQFQHKSHDRFPAMKLAKSRENQNIYKRSFAHISLADLFIRKTFLLTSFLNRIQRVLLTSTLLQITGADPGIPEGGGANI